MTGLAVYDPAVGRIEMGVMWTVVKDDQWCRCVLRSHPMGWELRKVLNDDLLRSEVCKHQGDVFTLAAKWQKEAIEKGWA